MSLVQVEELPAHMRPTRGLDDLSRLVEFVEARVPISLQDAAIVLQMTCRMFAPAIRRVSEPHRRRRVVSSRTIVPNIRPQTTGLRFAIAGFEHRNRHIVAVQSL